ncbi:hypothetical protein ACS0KU_004740 [Vibrio alginolyticus]|nr:hypothetical protein [Vibrio alginolyticus]ELK9270624.1 hypothetical protein [Vibrio alginolyticus]ELN6908295.1 hypothetical protein [Vibrio alginolyticus]EME3979881.1 hypothetical protein [Vibrio alginolyticus]
MEVLVILVLSILFRVIRNKPIFTGNLDGALYHDNWISGHSLNVFRVLGVAQKCLWIRVTSKEVMIGPHFPFCLFFLPEIFGCEWRFEKKDLINVENNIDGVVVAYISNGRIIEFRVCPRDKARFIAAATT